MRMIYLIFGILVVMFLVNWSSFKYFDPQCYKFKSLTKNDGGEYYLQQSIM